MKSDAREIIKKVRDNRDDSDNRDDRDNLGSGVTILTFSSYDLVA
jgi:hypothetical protein